MKNYVYLLIAPILFSMLSCGSNLPPRKSGQFVNVTFIGHDVTSNCPTFAPIGRDLDIKLDIPFIDHEDAIWEIEPTIESEGMLDKPVEQYYVSLEDIHIKIAGKEYKNAWYFYYRHNDDNLLKIKKEYMVNDVTIEITSRPFGDLYLYGIVIGEEMLNRWVGHEGKKDLRIDFQTFYQRNQYPIKTLDGQRSFPVLEHDNIDVTFKTIGYNCEPLPDDIRFRCNSRYAYMGIDYTREYSDIHEFTYNDPDTGEPVTTIGYSTCHLVVPHYVVTDHVSFRQYGTE